MERSVLDLYATRAFAGVDRPESRKPSIGIPAWHHFRPTSNKLNRNNSSLFCTIRSAFPDELEANVLITTVDKIYNWSRRSSMWPLLFGLACCAIEMIATAASRYDLARFGMEVMRPAPARAT